MGNVPNSSVSSISFQDTSGFNCSDKCNDDNKQSQRSKTNQLHVSKSFMNFHSSHSDLDTDIDPSDSSYTKNTGTKNIGSISMTDLRAYHVHRDDANSSQNKGLLKSFRNKLKKKKNYSSTAKNTYSIHVTEPMEDSQIMHESDHVNHGRLSISFGEEPNHSNNHCRSSLVSNSTINTSPSELSYRKQKYVVDSPSNMNISRSTSEIERSSNRTNTSGQGFIGILNVKKRLGKKHKENTHKSSKKFFAFGNTPKSLSSPRRSNLDATRLAEGFYRQVSLNDECSGSSISAKTDQNESSLAFMNKNFTLTPEAISHSSEENRQTNSGDKTSEKKAQLVVPSSSVNKSFSNQLEKINETTNISKNESTKGQYLINKKSTTVRKKSMHSSIDWDNPEYKKGKSTGKNLTKSLSCYALKFFHANAAATQHNNSNLFGIPANPTKPGAVEKDRLQKLHEMQRVSEKPYTTTRSHHQMEDGQRYSNLTKQTASGTGEDFDSKRRMFLIQTSTSELLKCLSHFIAERCSHLIAGCGRPGGSKSGLSADQSSGTVELRRRNDSIGFQPVAIITWIRCIDRALLVQGWSETAFISPANVIFFFMLLKDYVNEQVPSEFALHSIVMACLYLSYAYMGNEISYPLKPFLNAEINNTARSLRKLESRNKRSLSASVMSQSATATSRAWNNSFNDEHLAANCTTDQERDRFWARCLTIMNEKSTDMLRINSDAKVFTSLYHELKSYSTGEIANNGQAPTPPIRARDLRQNHPSSKASFVYSKSISQSAYGETASSEVI